MNQPDPSWISLLIHWMISGSAVLITSRLVRGFEVNGFFSACLAALVIAAANTVLWPILFYLTLPITVITLGLFALVVNGAVLKISAALLPGFRINGWLPAIFGSIVLAFFNSVFHYFLF